MKLRTKKKNVQEGLYSDTRDQMKLMDGSNSEEVSKQLKTSNRKKKSDNRARLNGIDERNDNNRVPREDDEGACNEGPEDLVLVAPRFLPDFSTRELKWKAGEI